MPFKAVAAFTCGQEVDVVIVVAPLVERFDVIGSPAARVEGIAAHVTDSTRLLEDLVVEVRWMVYSILSPACGQALRHFISSKALSTYR
jgi:hypothetical protein